MRAAAAALAALLTAASPASAQNAPGADAAARDPWSDPAVMARAARIGEYRRLATIEAEKRGLPPAIADAVMKVESNYNPAARGKDGEYGLMQVMPPTARMLGHKGDVEALADPEVNIALGVRYLAEAWRLAKGDICTAAMKYRAGHGETRFSLLSVQYCQRVRQHLAALNHPVTGDVPEPTFGFARDATRMGVAIGTQQAARRLASGKKLRSRVGWGSYDTRMRTLQSRGRVSL